MKIVFEIGGQFLEIVIDKERNTVFRGPSTNNKFIDYDELGSMSDNDPGEVRAGKFIIQNLKDLDAVEKYVIMEFERKGLTHIKTIRDKNDTV